MIVRHATVKDVEFFNQKFSNPWVTPKDFQFNGKAKDDDMCFGIYDFRRYITTTAVHFSAKLCDVADSSRLFSPVFVRSVGREANRVLRPLNGLSYRKTVGDELTENWLVPMEIEQTPGLARALVREHQPLIECFQWLTESDSALAVFSLPITREVTFNKSIVVHGADEEHKVTGTQRFCMSIPSAFHEESPEAMRVLIQDRNNSRVVDATKREGDFHEDFNDYFNH